MRTFLFFLFISIIQFSWAQNGMDNRGYKVKVGDTAPVIDLKLMDGSSITNENLKGRVVVLQFTASWCVVCRKEMPHLEKEVWQRFKNDDFLLVGVDLKESPEVVQKFIEQMKITYPVALDKKGLLFESFTLPRAGVTRNIVLDREGKIIFLTRLYDTVEFQNMIDRIAEELQKT